ncbi:MAG: dynamin family protein [Akkermansia sp.]|nr:dynamin family protein [Akkermansia sp.]
MDAQLDKICQDAKEFSAKLDGLVKASPDLRQLTARSSREIQRSLARFRSNLLLMATIGSVKSGKSTLTNCLAHRGLCATKLGIETTRLPMVILASDDGTERMELFSPLAAGSLGEQELFELVIDYLRKVAPDDFDEKVSIERRNLSQANLDAWAQGHTSAGCAAIFLVEPKAKLLQAGIGIVDMPGMDGLTSNWHDEKLHEWMNENADYFLLVQSSFAALTPDTREYLRTAMERSQRPIRVVQNRIEAQHWLTPDEQQLQQEKQQYNTQKQLSDFIRKVIPGSWVNAGLAWWQMENAFRPDAPVTEGTSTQFQRDPHINELVDEILSDLRNPSATLRRNSSDYLLKTLERIDDRLKEFIRKSQEHISHIHAIQAAIRKLMDSARLREAVESNNLHEGRMRCGYLADRARQTLNTRLDAILDFELVSENYFPTEWKKSSLPAQELNRLRVKVENDLGDLLAEQETHILAPAKICELTELEKEILESCANTLDRRSVEEIRTDYVKAILNVWKDVPLNCSPVQLGELKETAFMGMINRNCSYNETTPEWRRSGRKDISDRLDTWKRKVGEALDMFISARVNALKNCLASELNAYEHSELTGRSIAAAEQDIELCHAVRKILAPTLLQARRLKAIQ